MAEGETGAGRWSLALVAALVCGLPLATQAATYQRAANEQVLQLWAQASGMAAPELVEGGGSDGGTRLEWKTGVSYDYYQNRSRGGFLLTPVRDESANNTAQLQTEARASGRGGVSWFTLGASFSDDRAVLDHPTLISNLQMGHAGERYRVALGDVPTGFSTLGTDIGLRGLLAEAYLGSALLQAVAGVQADSWESIARDERRSRYQRNSYGFKLEQPFGESFSAYLSTQAYADDRDEDMLALTGLAPADGDVGTAGFNFRQGSFVLKGEAGSSRWKEKGLNRERDHAWVLDASWQGERLGLQAGYHDLGLYYTSLSGAALSGVSETYANASWLAADWLSLNADVRHTENERAGPPPGAVLPLPLPYTPNAAKADSWMLGADIAIRAIEGMSLQLSHSGSDGENDGGSRNDQQDSLASLQFSRDGWSSGLGWQRSEVDNDAAAAMDSTIDGWHAFVGREWVEARSASWSLGTTLTLANQRQKLDGGARNSSDSWQFALNGQHVRFGQFSALWYEGRVRDPATGQHLDQRGIQLEAGHALGRHGSVKLYYSRNDSFEDRSDIAYLERTLGLRFMSAF